MLPGMEAQIAVRLSGDALAGLDEVVQEGRYESRAAAVRAGVELLLRAEREREIFHAYGRGYGMHPDDDNEWTDQAGLLFMAQVLSADESI